MAKWKEFIPTEEEQRGWRYIVLHPVATAAEVAAGADISIMLAANLIDRIGTPKEVLLQAWEQREAAKAAAEPAEPEGRKDDAGKLRYDLLPPEALDAMAAVLSFGANRYGDRNWEAGMRWGRPFAALMRHMWAWWRGERADPDTGYSHLWHALCCIVFLVAYEARSTGIDDRPRRDIGGADDE
jgi:hypothetical protein